MAQSPEGVVSIQSAEADNTDPATQYSCCYLLWGVVCLFVCLFILACAQLEFLS